MDMKANNCPNCGAALHFEANSDTCFCSHCGTQVLRDSNNKTITLRTIDEARIKEAEVKDRQQKRAIIFSLVMILVMIAFVFFVFKLMGVYFKYFMSESGAKTVFDLALMLFQTL